VTLLVVNVIGQDVHRIYPMPAMAYSPAGLDAACSVRLTAASASEGKRMDTNEQVLAEPKPAGPQRRTQAIAVWVRPAERAKIQRLAASSGLSMSVYLKTLAWHTSRSQCLTPSGSAIC
jgi:Mobilization protein NikA